MAWFSLKQTVAPTTEPVTRDEAKLWMRVDHAEDDALIDSLIATSRRLFEDETARQLVTATWQYKLDHFPLLGRRSSGGISVELSEIVLPRTPLSSVTSITYIDQNGTSQTLATTVYEVDTASEPGRVLLKRDQDWPSTDDRSHAVTVTYVAGYGAASAVPDIFKNAIKLLTAHYYDHRAAVLVTVGGNVLELPIGLDRLIWLLKVPSA